MACGKDNPDNTEPDDKENPAIVDVSNPEESSVAVVSYSHNGTVLLQALDKDAVKVGDIICSGPCDVAPFGFCSRVVEIKQVETRLSLDPFAMGFPILWFEAKIVDLTITEMLRLYDVDVDRWFDINIPGIDTDKIVDEEGNAVNVDKTDDGAWSLISKPLEFKTSDNSTVKVTPNIKIKPEKLSVYLDADRDGVHRFGAICDWTCFTSVEISADVKLKEWKKDFSTFYIVPIPISVDPPIVITLVIQPYFEVSLDGTIKADLIPISTSYSVDTGAYYNLETKTVERIEDRSDICKMRLIDNNPTCDPEYSVELKGALKVTPGIEFSFGLYGWNVLEKVTIGNKSLEDYLDILNVEFNLSFPTELSASLGLEVGLFSEENPVFIKDDCTAKCDFVGNVAFSLRFWDPVFKKLVDLSPNADFLKIPIFEEKNLKTIFFSDFSGTEVASSSNGYIEVKSKKHRPFFWNTAYPETGFGFYFKKEGSEDLMFYDLSEYYGEGYTKLSTFEFNRVISLSAFEKNVRYRCFPYTEVKMLYGLLGKTKVFRNGLSFIINDEGKVSTSSIEEIPGENL